MGAAGSEDLTRKLERITPRMPESVDTYTPFEHPSHFDACRLTEGRQFYPVIKISDKINY